MPAQTLAQLFGPKATRSGVKITMDLTDFIGVGLANATTASPSKACAAYLKWLVTNTARFAEDAEAGIAADTFAPQRSFVVRGTSNQIQNPINLYVYIPDTTREFDPDAVL
ncbi:MAG: hypothetical protein MUD14_10075 [Hydrococcus sp. Prado102]|jgi:hypothetical protein|nr:hypothetical protein [Hydrococcus sp. Prado102]